MATARRRRFTFRHTYHRYDLEDKVGFFLTKLQFEILSGTASLPDYLQVSLDDILKEAYDPETPRSS